MSDSKKQTSRKKRSLKFLFFLFIGTILCLLAISHTFNKKPVLVTTSASEQSIQDDLKERLTFHGSNTIGTELIPPLINAWLKSRNIEDIEISKSQEVTNFTYYTREGEKGLITILALDSNMALLGDPSIPNTGLLSGHCDIGMATRNPTRPEIRALQEKGLGNILTHKTKFPIALDGISVLVHPTAGINAINLENLAKIYAGLITNWKELGGEDIPIIACKRNSNSGASNTFRRTVMLPYELKFSQKNLILNNVSDIIDKINATPGAIGFASTSIKSSKLKTLELMACEQCQSVYPNPVSVRSLEYPMSRTMFLYSPEKRSHITQLFLNYVKSEPAYEVIQNLGFLKAHGLFVDEEEGKKYGNLQYKKPNIPAKQKSIAFNWDRSKTAVSLRFLNNSLDLDERSEIYLKQIKALMHQKAYKDYKIMLVGHSCASLADGAKADAKNQVEVIRKSLWSSNFKHVQSYNLSSSMMVSDPKNLDGRGLNRRVNIWIRKKADSKEKKQ